MVTMHNEAVQWDARQQELRATNRGWQGAGMKFSLRSRCRSAGVRRGRKAHVHKHAGTNPHAY